MIPVKVLFNSKGVMTHRTTALMLPRLLAIHATKFYELADVSLLVLISKGPWQCTVTSTDHNISISSALRMQFCPQVMPLTKKLYFRLLKILSVCLVSLL